MLLQDGPHLDELSIEHFIGRAAVFDFSDEKIQSIDINTLKQYEEKIKELAYTLTLSFVLPHVSE